MKNQRTYYLISTINSAIEGWHIYASGTKKEMNEKIKNIFNYKRQGCGNIELDTLQKNARIVCKTKAKRIYKVDFDNFNYYD